MKTSTMWNQFTDSTKDIRQGVCNNCSCQASKGGITAKHFTHHLKTQQYTATHEEKAKSLPFVATGWKRSFKKSQM